MQIIIIWTIITSEYQCTVALFYVLLYAHCEFRKQSHTDSIHAK